MAQQAHTFQVIKTVQLDYLLHLPPGYEDDAQQKWPLILFLHRGGEGGHDLERVKKHGMPKILEARTDLPFVVVSPQCPEESWWPMETEALGTLLDDIVARYRVDTRRLYLTGLSMGGFGTWHLATKQPQRFAALVPICGGFHGPSRAVCVLRGVPIWAFHGAKDPVVPIEAQRLLVEALQECDSKVRFTVYPEAEHDSWTATYDNADLYAWLLEQSL